MSSNGTTYPLDSTCGTLAEARKRLDRSPASVALVDMRDAPNLNELGPLIGRYNTTRFVVIAEQRDPELLMQAMQVGVRFVMSRGSVRQDLSGVLGRFREADRAEEPPVGSLVTVLSAGGGSGATTIAVNLADELRRLCKAPALLIDMDVNYGAAGSYLGMEGTYGIADVLNRGQVDQQLLQSTAQSHDDDLDVLLSPVATQSFDPSPLNGANLQSALDACRRCYTSTVIDAPRVSMEFVETLVANSHAVLLVLQLGVKDVRMASTMLKAMRRRGMPMDQVMPVINRYRGRHQWLNLAEVQEALGEVEVGRVSDVLINGPHQIYVESVRQADAHHRHQLSR
ncbi:MAG: hypothetical protein WD294_16925 [Phycisphaeraceae bacterium]